MYKRHYPNPGSSQQLRTPSYGKNQFCELHKISPPSGNMVVHQRLSHNRHIHWDHGPGVVQSIWCTTMYLCQLYIYTTSLWNCGTFCIQWRLSVHGSIWPLPMIHWTSSCRDTPLTALTPLVTSGGQDWRPEVRTTGKQLQGSHSDWKNGKAFSSQGKVREFWTDWKSQGKLHKILEKWENFR